MQAITHMGSQIRLIVAAGICKAAHLCKHLTDQDLVHGMTTWHVETGAEKIEGDSLK